MSEELKHILMIWVDDMVLPAKTIYKLLKNTAMLLDLCFFLHFKFHPKKGGLYRREVN